MLVVNHIGIVLIFQEFNLSNFIFPKINRIKVNRKHTNYNLEMIYGVIILVDIILVKNLHTQFFFPFYFL